MCCGLCLDNNEIFVTRCDIDFPTLKLGAENKARHTPTVGRWQYTF